MSFCVVIRGPLGVGKSTVSARLAEVLGADHIPIDRILEDHGLEEWDEDRISLASFLRANTIALRQVRRALARGVPAVVDGNFYWKEQLDDLVRRVEEPVHVFTLEAPLAICIARDWQRPPPRNGTEPKAGERLGAEAAAAVYRLVAQVRYGVSLDATGSVEATVAAIVAHLGSATDHQPDRPADHPGRAIRRARPGQPAHQRP